MQNFVLVEELPDSFKNNFSSVLILLLWHHFSVSVTLYCIFCCSNLFAQSVVVPNLPCSSLFWHVLLGVEIVNYAFQTLPSWLPFSFGQQGQQKGRGREEEGKGSFLFSVCSGPCQNHLPAALQALQFTPAAAAGPASCSSPGTSLEISYPLRDQNSLAKSPSQRSVCERHHTSLRPKLSSLPGGFSSSRTGHQLLRLLLRAPEFCLHLLALFVPPVLGVITAPCCYLWFMPVMLLLCQDQIPNVKSSTEVYSMGSISLTEL